MRHLVNLVILASLYGQTHASLADELMFTANDAYAVGINSIEEIH